MATWQHLRSSTAHKRPTTSLADGRIAINTNTASPGLFFKDSAGTGIVKVGPVHVGATAPNSTPAAGGSSGNYLGEQWLDISLTPAQLKVWNGTAWVGVVADELPVSKLQDGAARQLLQTDAAGTGVEWTSNVDVPGTLDVTSTATFDSIARHPLGSASAPTLTFTGDTNTGIYSPGADQVAISTNGTGRLFIDASGDVGVGTASPDKNLHVSDAKTEVLVEGTNTSAGDLVAGISVKAEYYRKAGFTIYDEADNEDFFIGRPYASTNNLVVINDGSERIRIDSSGRLGLGTSSPGALLHLGGNTDNAVQAILAQGNDSNFRLVSINKSAANISGGEVSRFGIRYGTSTNDSSGIQFFRGNTSDEGHLGIYTGGTTRVYVQGGTGNVGVGTTSPTDSLHVYGGRLNVQTDTASTALNEPLIKAQTGPNGGALFQIRASNTADDNSNWELKTNANEALLFTIGASESARLDASGRLLVGTSNGSGGVSKLVVQGASNGFAVGVAQISYNGLASAALAAGTDIGYLRFTDQGSNSGVFAQITATADATTGAGDYPGRLVFSTTADGESSPTERVRIDSDGAIVYAAGTYNYSKRDSARTIDAGNTATVFDLWSGSQGIGHYLITTSAGSATTTRAVAVVASSSSSASFVYTVLDSSNVTIGVSGSSVTVANTGVSSRTFNTTAIPLSIAGN